MSSGQNQGRGALFLARIAQALTAAPRGADERTFFADIATLGDGALIAERDRLRLAVALSRTPWAVERLYRINRELAVRDAMRGAR